MVDGGQSIKPRSRMALRALSAAAALAAFWLVAVADWLMPQLEMWRWQVCPGCPSYLVKVTKACGHFFLSNVSFSVCSIPGHLSASCTPSSHCHGALPHVLQDLCFPPSCSLACMHMKPVSSAGHPSTSQGRPSHRICLSIGTSASSSALCRQVKPRTRQRSA